MHTLKSKHFKAFYDFTRFAFGRPLIENSKKKCYEHRSAKVFDSWCSSQTRTYYWLYYFGEVAYTVNSKRYISLGHNSGRSSGKTTTSLHPQNAAENPLWTSYGDFRYISLGLERRVFLPNSVSCTCLGARFLFCDFALTNHPFVRPPADRWRTGIRRVRRHEYNRAWFTDFDISIIDRPPHSHFNLWILYSTAFHESIHCFFTIWSNYYFTHIAILYVLINTPFYYTKYKFLWSIERSLPGWTLWHMCIQSSKPSLCNWLSSVEKRVYRLTESDNRFLIIFHVFFSNYFTKALCPNTTLVCRLK